METLAISNLIEPYQLRCCLVHQRGELIYQYEHANEAVRQLMPINSCTKSILSSLICIAMDRALLPQSDTLIATFFPELKKDSDLRKQSITLQHLLTLSAGFRWDEFGGLNSFPKMTRSVNWVNYVLKQPMSDAPGAKMVYNSGVSQLLAAVLAQAIDVPIAAFAETNLFGPLAIEHYNWKSDPQGLHTGGYGLQLCANDMLKFGLLYLHKGFWNNQQLITKGMTELSTQPFIAVTEPERGCYGWHWWVDSVPVPSKGNDAALAELHYYYARGYGGQFIIIVPALETVVVLTRDQRKKGPSPMELFRQHIAPMLA